MLKNRRCFGMYGLYIICMLISLPIEIQAGPAYRRLVTSTPAQDAWRQGFSIVLETDRQQCERAYGQKWPQECAAPPAGREGQRVEGISMTPTSAGVWRWESGNSIRFEPEGHLKPGTRHTISLEKTPLPSRYKLARKTITYTTQPQAVHIGREKIWIDPSKKGRHAISVPLRFIWPVDRSAMEKSISIAPVNDKSGLRLGTLRFVWNEDSDEVMVNAPVDLLPQHSTATQIEIEGLPAYIHGKNGQRELKQSRPQGNDNAAARFAIKGSKELMDVTQIRIVPAYGRDLEREYHLEIHTSLQVKPDDVLRHLDLRLLPRKSQATAGRDCDWTAMPAISAEDMARAERLTPTLLQPGQEAATITRFRLPAEAGRGLMAATTTGLPSTAGLKLDRVRRFILNVPSFEAEMHILQPGNILALSGPQHLDIHSIGLTSIRWRAERVREPFLALLAAHASFQDPHDADLDTMGTAVEGVLEIVRSKAGEPVFISLDMDPLFKNDTGQRHGLLRLTLTGFDGEKPVCHETRLLLSTDLGLMVKTAADASRTVFVRHLGSGRPAAGVEVRLLGANGLPVLRAVSDVMGRADLPSTKGLERERRPVAIVAVTQSGQSADMSWISLEEQSRRVDYSDFDVSGRVTGHDGLVASVFSQRGLYLPGETLHFGCILRQGDWSSLPADILLTASLYSPTGSKLQEKRLTLGKEGMTSMSWPVPEDAPTGLYRLDIRISGKDEEDGPVLGSTTVRVEEFQPDTLALQASFEPAQATGWIVSDTGARATVVARLDNLYGEPAMNHRLRARIRISPSVLRFPGYEDHTFPQMAPPVQGGEQELYEGYTDQNGEVRISLPLHKLPIGVLNGTILLEGFESEGGRAVTRSISALFAPQKIALGYKPEYGANDLDYIPQDAQAALRLIVLDNTLKPVSLTGASLILSARRYVNSLISDARGNYRYDATPVDTELDRQTPDIPAEGLSWPMPTAEAGDFLLTVRGPDGHLLASIPYSVAGRRLAEPDSLSPDALNKGDLRLKLEKTDYASGDTIRFRISAPFTGTGLVTIERDKVMAHAWFRAEPGESVQQITIPADFEGKGYLNVSFVRDAASDAIYMKPHAFSVAPFTAGVARRDMGLRLEVPASVLPGQQIILKVDARQTGKVQLFAVDEGVLQLTDFATPSPLRDLLLDRALSVDSRQAFDLLMPDHERLRGRIPGYGGGMDASGGRFINPFKRRNEPPLAFWSPLMDVGPKVKEVSIPIPTWCSGRIRIMAVGAAAPADAPMAVGSAQASTQVRGTLLLKPQLPLAVAPGDVFEGALVLANTVAGSGKGAQIRVDMELPQGISLLEGKPAHTLSIDENAEKSIRFRLRAMDVPGVADIRFIAQVKNGQPVVRRQSLSIRPMGPRLRSEKTGELGLGLQTIPVGRDLFPFDAQRSLSVASAPILALRTLIQRLDTYPYTCTEQSISRAMPYVALWDAPALQTLVMPSPERGPEEIRKARDAAISRAVAAIRAAFSPYDGVSPWPGSKADLFVTVYAADFLVSMRESGMAVPEGLATSVLDCLERFVDRTPDDVTDGRYKIYGAWVLLRDGRIMTSSLNMLETWFKENTSKWEQDVLATLLADGFHMLRLKRRASQRLPEGQVQGTSDRLFSSAMARALHALILHRSFGEHLEHASMQALLDTAFSENATTVDMAMSARALAVLAQDTSQTATGLRLSCQEYVSGHADSSLSLSDGPILQLHAPSCRRFAVEGQRNATGGLYWHLVEDGHDRGLPTAASNGMEIRRRYLDVDGEAVTTLRLGQAITVEVCARSIGEPRKDVALVDLMPGGLEPILEKDAATGSTPGLVRQERREDRTLFFVDLGMEEACYRYRARAVSRGNFGLPPVTGQAMYAPEQRAVSGGGSLTIR